MDRKAAEKAIKALFAQYKAKITKTDKQVLKALTDGKLYELFVLSKVVETLVNRGAHLTFHGTSLKFKGGPGMIKASDPHFSVHTPYGLPLQLFVDIEFDTLGQHHQSATDNSRRHELDIVLTPKTAGYPAFDDVWLAVECKAVANFGKGIVKEALGVRRELCFLHHQQPSRLTQVGLSPINVTAEPASEFWLAFIDPKGLNYAQSPAAFGIELHHLDP